MAYSNSPLVNYTLISPNRTVNREHSIDTITIHCVVGQCTVEALGATFVNPARRASSNYGIGYDGRIGLYVEEKDRAWTSSNSGNDARAITIETASDTYAPYAVTDAAFNSLIKLCADICKRNNIKQLLWKNDKNLIGQVDKQNMTLHQWFAATGCPGDYLKSRMETIANEVNKLLGPTPTPSPTPTTTFKPGDLVKIIGTTYYTGAPVPSVVLAKNWYVDSVSGDRVVVNKSEDGTMAIMSPFYAKDLQLVKAAKTSTSNTTTASKPKETTTSKPKETAKTTFAKGDIVQFAGGYHYPSANSYVKTKVAASRAKVLAVAPNALHPYSLRAVNENNNFIYGVYGWVDASDVSTVPTSANKKKTNEAIAKEVIAGTCSDPRWNTWGNGATRVQRLTAAGYNATVIQSIIDKLMK